MRRLTHLVVLVAFIFSCGGQWAVFQALAWGNMIHEYSQMVPLTQAVKMTFSGEYPCKICKALADQKTSDQQKALSQEKFDKKFVPLPQERVFVLASAPVRYSSRLPQLHFRSEPPDNPPPRSALL